MQAFKGIDVSVPVRKVYASRGKWVRAEPVSVLYNEGRVMTEFTWQTQDDYATTLRTNMTAEPLREIARDLWGADWTMAVIGF